MTVNVTKPAINVREKLAEVDKPTGLAGEAMLRAETPQEQFNLIGAGRRNLIINGAMQVAQRGTSFTGLTNGSARYTLDRWLWAEGGSPSSVVSVTQETDSPDGFAASLKVSPTTADASIDPNEIQSVTYYIEAQDIQHLAYGTTAAKTMTLSFWVKCSQTGRGNVWAYQEDAVRSNTLSYTINSADTWEYKTITIVGDTSGVINNDTGAGFRLEFHYASGTDYTGTGGNQGVWGAFTNTGRSENLGIQILDTTSDYFQITGVQLEVGKVATPFEHRSYGQELALCQRYYQKYSYNNNYEASGFTGIAYTTTQCYFTGRYDVPMRAKPSMVANNMRVDYFGGGYNQTGYGLDNSTSNLSAFFFLNVSSGLTVGNPYHAIADASGSSYLAFDAEL